MSTLSHPETGKAATEEAARDKPSRRKDKQRVSFNIANFATLPHDGPGDKLLQTGRNGLLHRLPQHFQERLSPLLHSRLEAHRAVAVAAGPGLLAVEVAAALAAVSVLDADEIEVLLPIGPLLGERL